MHGQHRERDVFERGSEHHGSGGFPGLQFPRAEITDLANGGVPSAGVAVYVWHCDRGYEASIKNLAHVTLQSHNVFGDDGGVSQLGTTTGDVTNGYAVVLTDGVDTTTTPTAGAAPGDGRGGGPGGPPPGG